jgi:hypothetical protein
MNNTSSMPAINSYIHALLDAKHWSRLIYVLEYLDDTDNGYGVTYLVKYLSDYTFLWSIGRACRAHGQPSFVIEALRQSLKEVEKAGDKATLISKLLIFGEFYHDFYDQDDETIRWWEEALARINEGDSDIQRRFRNNKVIYTNKTAQLYYDIAVQNFKCEQHLFSRPLSYISDARVSYQLK